MTVAPTPGAESQVDNTDLVLRFGDTTPKREVVIIGDQEYQGYVWNKRVPRTIRAMVYDAYREARDANGQVKNQVAQENAVNKALMAMIPGCSYTAIDALDPEEIYILERRLGLRDAVPGGNQEEVESNSPPMGVATLNPKRRIGAKSSSDSRRRSA